MQSEKGWVGGIRVAPAPAPAPPPPPPSIGGTYVGYVSSEAPDADFSLVVETMDGAASTCAYGNSGWGPVPAEPNHVQFCVSDSVCTHHRELNVRFSRMSEPSGLNATRFEAVPAIALPRSGSGKCCFAALLEPNCIYSYTTTTAATKGVPDPKIRQVHAVEGAGSGCGTFDAPITAVNFPFPYHTDFSPAHVRFDDFPEFLSDMQGIFRVRPDPFGGGAQVLQQLLTAPRNPALGGFGQAPLSLLGAKNWSDYTATVQARTNASDPAATVAIYARVGHGYAFGGAGGYVFEVAPATGAWSLRTGSEHTAILCNGTLRRPPAANQWVELGLTVVANRVAATVSGVAVVSATDPKSRYASGFAGLGGGWHPAWYRDFGVGPA